MIIHDSDNLGLSQLYQLRGRVGRSNRTAYAFLMYKRDKMLKEVAEKRLAAIKEFTDLGSGFKIAMRDWRSEEPEICWECGSMGTWRQWAMRCIAKCSTKP